MCFREILFGFCTTEKKSAKNVSPKPGVKSWRGPPLSISWDDSPQLWVQGHQMARCPFMLLSVLYLHRDAALLLPFYYFEWLVEKDPGDPRKPPQASRWRNACLTGLPFSHRSLWNTPTVYASQQIGECQKSIITYRYLTLREEHPGRNTGAHLQSNQHHLSDTQSGQITKARLYRVSYCISICAHTRTETHRHGHTHSLILVVSQLFFLTKGLHGN